VNQSRTMSLVESVTNTIVGIVVAVYTQILVFPLFGLPPLAVSTNIQLALVFTTVSLARSYIIRRIFNSFDS
jgi:hypothetical protein